MNTAEAKRFVIGGVALAGALNAGSDLSKGRWPKLRVFIGVMALGMALAIVAEGAPDLAATFALLLATTAMFTAGTDTFAAIGRLFD